MNTTMPFQRILKYQQTDFKSSSYQSTPLSCIPFPGPTFPAHCSHNATYRQLNKIWVRINPVYIVPDYIVLCRLGDINYSCDKMFTTPELQCHIFLRQVTG